MPSSKKPPARPTKMRGWLTCHRCSKTTEFYSLGEGPERDGGWPLHRCGYGIGPFDAWSTANPDPLAPSEPLFDLPPGPLEEADHE